MTGAIDACDGRLRAGDSAGGPPRGSAAVTRAVESFYERHPYPPPVAGLEGYARSAEDDSRRRADAALFRPGRAYRTHRRVLVAGCGTSQAARIAIRWPDAEVVGIDLSTASIRETDTLRRRHRLDNLSLRVLDIAAVGDLGGAFDHVVCTGVLHHLPDPDAGLRALRSITTPDATFHLMVYAPYGRAAIYALQDYCRRLDIGTSSDELRDLAATLALLPPSHPLAPLLRHARDFQTEAGLADALLHPQDRPYSVPQVFALLAGARLRLARWCWQAPYLAHCGLLAASPHAPRLRALPIADHYAAAELLRGSMVQHSFVAVRSEAEDDVPCTGWPAIAGLVALRRPDTIAVEEKLPPGAAAVLINRNHGTTDVYLPIDQEERRLFERIDGRRTVAEIVDGAVADLRAARLFAALWHHDQIVFAAGS